MRERLYRSRTERMFLGVAGGLAEWFDVDPAFVRIAFVLLTVPGGVGVILYIAMAIIVPERPIGAPVVPGAGQNAGQPIPEGQAPGGGVQRKSDGRGAMVFGVILVIAGAWFLVKQYLPDLDLDYFWPALLVVVGVVLIVGSLRRGEPRN